MPSVSIVVPLPKLPALRYGRLGRVIVGGGLRGMVYHATMMMAHGVCAQQRRTIASRI